MNSRTMGVIVGILGALTVCIGAFGAHALKAALPEDKLATFTTGVTYQYYHLLAMGLIFLIVNNNSRNVWFIRSFVCFLIGIVLFSGSLYLLATRELIGLTTYKWLGPLTPVGGLFFIVGWVFFALGSWKKVEME